MPELEPPAVTVEVRPDIEYQCSTSAFDEMIRADGEVRPHWRTFAEQLKSIGLDEFEAALA